MITQILALTNKTRIEIYEKLNSENKLKNIHFHWLSSKYEQIQEITFHCISDLVIRVLHVNSYLFHCW